jgi:TPR repeat protein
MSHAEEQALEYVVEQDERLWRVYAQRGAGPRLSVYYSRQQSDAEDYAQALRELQAAFGERRRIQQTGDNDAAAQNRVGRV